MSGNKKPVNFLTLRPYASTTLSQVDVYTVHRVTEIVAGLSKIGIFVFTLIVSVIRNR